MMRSMRALSRYTSRTTSTIRTAGHSLYCFSDGVRALSVAAPHKASAVSEILSSAAATNPLKDAVKFYSADGTFTGATTPGASEDPDIWTYFQLNANVDALTAGLQTLGYGKGDTILVWLPYTSPEYLTLVLAVANTGSTLMTIAPPADPNNVDMETVKAALEKAAPKMFIFDQSYQTTSDVSDVSDISDKKISKVSSVLEKLVPEISTADSAGYSGFSPLSGRSFVSTKYPSISHVVHTDSAHIRGAITFKSILSYSGAQKPAVKSSKSSYIVASDTGNSSSTKEAISSAAAMGAAHNLSADQASKTGKIVVTPSHTPESATAIIAAIMHETLWIMPADANQASEIAETENATLLQ